MDCRIPVLSIILPARQEAIALRGLLPRLKAAQPSAQIIVVNDGSTDETEALCAQHGVECVSRPYSMGNGAAIKAGARYASGDILVFMDADGQHAPEDIEALVRKLDEGFDMVVGARSWGHHANLGRGLANSFYNALATWISNCEVRDLTSGFRAVRASKFREVLYLLPNGFSYPTTSTMAFLRSAYPVAFVPIDVSERIGKSHIRPIKDGVRFLLIIFRIATLYSPLKLFFPASALFFVTGLSYYCYTLLKYERFTNMSLLLFSASVIIFLIGLVSEQITALMYKTPHQ